MTKEPSEGALILAQTAADPLLRCLYVFLRPFWDVRVTPDITMVDALHIGLKRGVNREVLLHELVLEEEASVTEVARDDI